VPTRRLPAKSIQTLPFIDVIQANVHQEDALRDLVKDQDVVINLVAILHGSSADFDHTHVQLAKKLAKICAETSKRSSSPLHLIQMSALGAEPHAFVNAPSLYLKSKGEAEYAMIELAWSTPLRLSILRPSVIFGEDDQFINLFASLQKIFPFMPLGCANARFQPVWVHDVISAVLCLIHQPRSITKADSGDLSAAEIYELGGPDVLSLKELVHIAGRYAGKQRPVLPLPLPLAKLQALMMQLMPGKTLMSLDNVASMQRPNTVSSQWPQLKDLGIANPKPITAVFRPKI
jgi:NADH dehydrogenase